MINKNNVSGIERNIFLLELYVSDTHNSYLKYKLTFCLTSPLVTAFLACRVLHILQKKILMYKIILKESSDSKYLFHINYISQKPIT